MGRVVRTLEDRTMKPIHISRNLATVLFAPPKSLSADGMERKVRAARSMMGRGWSLEDYMESLSNTGNYTASDLAELRRRLT